MPNVPCMLCRIPTQAAAAFALAVLSLSGVTAAAAAQAGAAKSVAPGWSEGPEGCPARFAHTAVWDAADAGFLVFGGEALAAGGFTMFDDLWLYAPSRRAWTALAAPGGPSRRAYHASAWDSKRQAMWVFGGSGPDFAPLDELWKLDGATHAWERVAAVGPAPAGRLSPALQYWAKEDRLILFGGAKGFFEPGCALAETWSFDPGKRTWTRSAAKAPGRWQCACALDEAGARMVVQGGFDGAPTPTDGTWIYDLAKDAWTDAGKGPRTTEAHAAVWDAKAGRMLAYGGALDGRPAGSAELSAWRDGAWRSVSDASPPGARAYFAMAREPDDGAVFIFGGVLNQFGTAAVRATPWLLHPAP